MEHWEISENLKGFFDRPVVIAILSILFGLMVFLVIFSKTSLGKKALNKLSNGFNLLMDKFAKHEEKTESKIKQLEEYYEKEKLIAESKIAALEELCIALAENSHNEKVKDALNVCRDKLSIAPTKYEELVEGRIKEEKAKIEQEFKDFYEGYFQEQKARIEQLVAKVEKTAEIAENKAKETIEEVVEVKEVIENEGKEIIDTNSEEEKVSED